MVLKGYFDGGNQADSTQYDRITLATALGTCEQWSALEWSWKEVIENHKAQFLHTTNAIGLKKEFAKEKGWDDGRVDSLISDCVNVIDQHIVEPGRIVVPGPYGLRQNITKFGLFVTTLTIPLSDYQRVKKINPKLPNSVTEVCTTESLGFCFKWGKIHDADSYELFFDQGEPFFGHAYDRKHNKQSKKDIAAMKQVVVLAEADMRVSPALQIADLFAWCINHNDDVRRDWHKKLHSLPWNSLVLDYDHLLNPTPGALERTAAWNLPTRKLDR